MGLLPRNYVYMEVKQNLISTDRKENLQRFALPHFKKIAHVVLGEPSSEFTERARAKILEEKQAKSDHAWRIKKTEADRQQAIADRNRQMAEQQKKTLEEKKQDGDEQMEGDAKIEKKEEIDNNDVK